MPDLSMEYARRPATARFRGDASRLARQERVTAWLDIVLGVLAVVMLGLLVLEIAVSLGDPWDTWIVRGQVVIWAIFVAAFVFELALAPSAVGYLRSHWLVALSLVIPALRVFRVLKAIRVLRGARALRGFQLVRTSTAFNRVAGAVREFFRFSRFAYLVMLTMALSLTSGALVSWLEEGHPRSNIDGVGDGIWWAITTVTTINSPLEPVTFEGRAVALALRLFGLAVIGYLTAVIAVFLLGKREAPEAPARQDEIRALRREIGELRELLAEDRGRGADRGREP